MNNSNIKHDRILYLDGMETMYTRQVRDTLKSLYKEVDCYFFKDIYKPSIFLRHINPSLNKKLQHEKITDFINFIKLKKYDIIFAKAPYFMPRYFFEMLAESFPNIPRINYNWVPIALSDYLPYREYFTKVYSFDPHDCKKYDLNYYPLFYLKEYEDLWYKNKNKLYDYIYIGSGNSPGKLEFLDSFNKMEKLKSLNTFLYIYIYGKLNSAKVRLKYPKLSQYCYWHMLSVNEVINVFSVSGASIDHAMTSQTGFTMRTFETLAAGLNLYTTNKEIVNEPFYDPKRIVVIDNDNLNNVEFRSERNRELNKSWQDSFRQYRIDNWVKEVLKT